MVQISTGNTPEIATRNIPKSSEFQGESRFLRVTTLPEVITVEISDEKKNLVFEKFGSKKCILHFNSIS